MEHVLMLELAAIPVCLTLFLRLFQFSHFNCTAYGGYGFTARMWGLTLDTIQSLDVVLADGTITSVSSASNPDLYWVSKT